jgi:hypothetical protein
MKILLTSTAHVRNGLASLLCLGLLCSCATTQTKTEPWLKDGQRVGDIKTTIRPWGKEVKYNDLSTRTLREERRNLNGDLLTGNSITLFTYNDNGDLTEEKHLNSSEQMVRSKNGYFSVCRWSYQTDHDGNRVIEQTFFDEKLLPASQMAGYTILQHTEDASRQLKKVAFFDGAHQPVPSTWLKVSNVVEVQYAYLDGVTAITCAAFLDNSGRIVERKQLSGHVWDSYTTQQNSYNAGNTYYYQTTTYHDAR